MKQEKPSSKDLRSKAEGALNSVEDSSCECSSQDMRQLIHELQVHQVELEMQNEELRSAQAEIEESRMRYADLYDFSPVGYLTFDQQRVIVEANLTAAKQLSTERAILINKPFSLYLRKGDRDVFHLHLAKVLKTRERQTCEVKLSPRKSDGVFARLDSIFIEDASGNSFVRTSISDISSSRHAEEELKRAHAESEDRVAERTSELSLANEQLRREIEDRKRVEKILRRLVDFDEMMTQVLGHFAACALDDIDTIVVKGLDSIAQFIGADHAYVIIISPDSTTWSVTHEWCGPHVSPRVHKYQARPMGTMPWGEDRILAGETVRINSTDDYPPGALPERLYHQEEGTASVLILPFRNVTGQIAGCIGVETHSHPNVWSDDDVLRLTMIGDRIASLLERKRAEAALRDREERFRLSLDGSNLGAWDWNIPKGQVTYFRHWAEMLGYAAGEIDNSARSWLRLIHPDDKERVKSAIEDHLEGRTLLYETEQRVLAKSKEWRWLLFRGRVIRRDEEGRPLRAVGVHIDVTERRTAEEELWKSRENLRIAEEKYRGIFENALEGIYETSPEGNNLTSNPALAKILGYDSTEDLISTITDSAHQVWVNPSQRLDYIRLLEQNGVVLNYECEYYRKDKTRIWVSLSSRRVAGPDGETLHYSGFIEDITERKRAQEALKESETKFRSYIESAPLAIFVADREGRLIDFNPAATDLLGCDTAILKNMHILDLHPEDDSDEVLRKFATLLETGHLETEARMKKCDGQIIWVSLHVVMTSDRLSLGYCRDITERKKVEDALKQSEE
ncbi:MAG: PAS domain S-box protein, partial [Syntrophobacteraceae bacterium]